MKYEAFHSLIFSFFHFFSYLCTQIKIKALYDKPRIDTN